MSIDIKQFNNYIIVPVLNFLAKDNSTSLKSESSRKLLLGTLAKESGSGTYLHQIRGVAAGAFQQENPSFNQLIQWYQINNKTLLERANKLIIVDAIDDFQELHGNLYWATAVCRLYYYHIRTPLPQSSDVYGLAQYWKKYYNRDGKGTVEEFVENYKRFGVDEL